MAWIKRNLYFVIGAAAAVLLLGLAAYYCYSKWSLNNENLEKLEAAYADWERIIQLNPSPGNQKNDNIKLARDQQKEVRAEI
ncbi:MAG TPA: Amuc_1100 family pilus-like protein, partial [Verrucomicrobiae bacterium]|nr:Amuc_1100 family pilus-like protein [Verrucomicrobiae bacterium]